MQDVGFHPSYISTTSWYDKQYETIDENLVQLLDQMTADSNRATALYKEYDAPYATIHIYAITEKSGTLTVPVGEQETEQFKQTGIGTTIIAWGEDKPIGSQTWEYQINTAGGHEVGCNVFSLPYVDPARAVVNDTPIVHI